MYCFRHSYLNYKKYINYCWRVAYFMTDATTRIFLFRYMVCQKKGYTIASYLNNQKWIYKPFFSWKLTSVYQFWILNHHWAKRWNCPESLRPVLPPVAKLINRLQFVFILIPFQNWWEFKTRWFEFLSQLLISETNFYLEMSQPSEIA